MSATCRPPSNVPCRAVGMALALLLAACTTQPPAPEWQSNARSAMDSATAAYLSGDSRVEAIEFARARDQISRTGRLDLMARIELMRCAIRVASLDFAPCDGFERVRADAAAPEQAYARHLAGDRLTRADIERLPAAQRVAAAAVAEGGAGIESADMSLRAATDPLARLIAIAVLFRSGRASPQLIGLAADTASAEGWRRPLLAWLQVQALRAEQLGEAAEAERLRRRIALVGNGR